MSRVVPEFNSVGMSLNSKNPIKIEVRSKNPLPLSSDNTSLNLINEIRRKESLPPKTKIRKFFESNSYIQYDSIWSRTLIILTLFKIALAIAFLIFYVRNCNAVAVYMHKDDINEEIQKKNKKIEELNRFQSMEKYTNMALGSLTIAFTLGQFGKMYYNNTFNTKDIDFTQI